MSAWSEQQRKYIDWLGMLEKLRPIGCRTKAQFSKIMGVTEDTLAQWELEPGFWSEVYVLARAVIGQNLTEVLTALYHKAKSGNIPAITLCLEVLNVHYDKIEIENTGMQEQIVVLMPAGTKPNEDQPKE